LFHRQVFPLFNIAEYVTAVGLPTESLDGVTVVAAYPHLAGIIAILFKKPGNQRLEILGIMQRVSPLREY
jgi:hypothetical protein